MGIYDIYLWIGFIVILILFAIIIVTARPWGRIAIVIVAPVITALYMDFSLSKAHHGDMNVRVGHPYCFLMDHMNTLATQGKTNELYELISKAHDNAVDIFGAWLYLQDCDEFRTFVFAEVEKTSPNNRAIDAHD